MATTVLIALVAGVTPLAGPVSAFAGQKPADNWQRAFPVRATELASSGESPYFILKPGYQLTLEGRESGKAVKLVVLVLDETRVIDGIEARVVEERETADGALSEVSRNFVAIHRTTRDVYYLGEEVDVYRNGKVVGHEGAWRHGSNGATLGLLVPGSPVIGRRHSREVAPGVAMDRAQVMSVSGRITTPAGGFEKCLETEETTPLEPGNKEYKVYAPGIGLVKDGPLVLVSYAKR